MKVQQLDLHFSNTPHAIGSFLVEGSKGFFLIESGPHSTFGQLKQHLADAHLSPRDLQAVLLTHIHLDHSGAAWALAQEGVKVYVHPKGVAHLIDPTKLIASAHRLYKEQMDTLWGKIEAIDEKNICPVQDKAHYEIAGVKVIAHATPGHAAHHIAWQIEQKIFTGDVAGVCIDQGPVIAPLPPPDIDINAWEQSIDRLEQLQPDTLYLTHFGAVNGNAAIQKHFQQLRKNIHSLIHFIQTYKHLDKEGLYAMFDAHIRSLLGKNAPVEAYYKANPPFMSVLGVLRYLKTQQRA